MTHISVVEALDGKHVAWLEHVTDEAYLPGPPRPADGVAHENGLQDTSRE
jgi:hypothetical protein